MSRDRGAPPAARRDASRSAQARKSARTTERAPAFATGHEAGGPGGRVPGLQRSAGNRAVSELVRSPSTVGGGALPASVRAVLSSGGRPLDPATRDYMESRFGHDLGDVRLHTDARAAESARDVQALAYTVGQDIVLGASSDAPSSQRGHVLLAHELAHAIQQRGTGGPPPSADPHGAVESSANAAAHAVGNGGRLSSALPASGVGLACAPVPLEELPEDRLQGDLASVTEKLKRRSYEGRDADVQLQARLLAALRAKAKAREPASPPPPLPPPPAPPPDPEAERAAAVKEANELLARLDAEEEVDKRAAEEEKRAEAKAAEASEKAREPITTYVTSEEMCQGRCVTDKDIYGPLEAANKRIDERIEKDRKATAKDSLEKRIIRVRGRLVGDRWYYPKGAVASMTAEQVWNEGFSGGDFAEGEKKAVYEMHGAHVDYLMEQYQEAYEREKTRAEIARDKAVLAPLKQIGSPTMFVQPFAYAALGPLIGAAYAGSQTGLLVGQTYNACKGGLSADCGAALTQDAAAVTLHLASKGKPGAPPPTGRPGPLTTRRAVTSRPQAVDPDFVITRTPTLDASSGKVRASMVERASGRTLDAEIDPRTGVGQIVDRKTREVVGEIRNGEVVPPTKNVLPPGSTAAPTGGNAPAVKKPGPPALTGSTVSTAPPALPQPPVTGTGTGTGAVAGAPATTATTAPSVGSPAPTPSTSRTAAAYSRLAETQQVLVRARERIAAAEDRLKTAEGNAQVARELNKGAQRGSTNKATAKEWLGKEEAELRSAQAELASAKKIEASVAGEVQHVASTQTKIATAERELAEVNRKMTEISNDPALLARGHTRNVAPERTAPRGKEYRDLENQKAQLEKTLHDLQDDLTRNVRDQVAKWTPGKRARPAALDNAKAVAETVPELAPVGSKPIDVTTGRPMVTDAWETDHIISRNTIANDPRFLLLDPAGRNTMINGIPENYLPMTKAANGMKGDMTVNEFIMYRGRVGEPIPPRMADGLRAAHARAEKAIDAMWDKLLKGK